MLSVTAVDAPQPFRLVASVEQVRAAMRAVLADQPDGPGRDAEGEQVLAEESHAQGRAVALGKLARQSGGHPVLAHQVTHGRPGSDPTEQLVVLATQHGSPLQSDVFVRRGHGSLSRKRTRSGSTISTAATFSRRSLAATPR